MKVFVFDLCSDYNDVMDNQFEDRNRRFHEACRRSVIEQVPWLVALEDQERLAVEAVMTHLVEDKFAADFGLAEPPGGALFEDPLEVSGIRETYLKDITDVWDAVFWPMRDVPGMARYVLMVLRHGDVVYHILPRDDWETAQFNGAL